MKTEKALSAETLLAWPGGQRQEMKGGCQTSGLLQAESRLPRE